jgi:hypothetical protein
VQAGTAVGWLSLAGLAYGVFGLAAYWGGYHAEWLFGGRTLAHDVRSTFINRNHFATWQGLTILCAIAWFYHRMVRPDAKPYAVPLDREARVETFILKSWQPLTALLLMVAALILTHSRGGFVASLCGVVTLLVLLDRRALRSGLGVGVSALAVADRLYRPAAFRSHQPHRHHHRGTPACSQRQPRDRRQPGAALATAPSPTASPVDNNEAAVHYDWATTPHWKIRSSWFAGRLALFALGGLALTRWRGVAPPRLAFGPARCIGAVRTPRWISPAVAAVAMLTR